MTAFQIIALAVFGVFIVGGLVFFATYRGHSAQDIGSITIWGTLDGTAMSRVIEAESNTDQRFAHVTYVEKDPATFDSDLAEALAAGFGPDLFLLPQDLIMREQNKIATISYTKQAPGMPQQVYENTFIGESSLFETASGFYGYPFLADPMVLYWNKDTFAKNGIARPPAIWDDVLSDAQAMSATDPSGTLSASAIALGESANVLHLKDILIMLVLQAGGTIMSGQADASPHSALSQVPSGAAESPAVSALRFYTLFADPSQSVYSWNSAEPSSRDAFAQGKTAMYLGFASELPLIGQQNPNLSYGVAPMPQIKGAARNVTFGTLYALAIPRTSANPSGAAALADDMTSADVEQQFSDALGLPPARRDLLASQADGSMLIFDRMALIADAWLDPNPAQTDAIFSTMVASVNSGSTEIASAVARADQALSALLQ
ncbi:MAG TPA: extracellular solute-binding protein [Candidatus Paceibacterota bacterium]|nr:extracellular solute-binding protein [Candidatus Paceibacterota bacterium]